MDADGTFFRSPAVKPITLLGPAGRRRHLERRLLLWPADRRTLPRTSLAKGVLVGDAATRLKQTLMFDLPIVDKGEVQALMKADVAGGGKRTSR